ncbi:MAG: hypothetical protein CL916_03940 [Deltaproteobacteria bacterium]|nr:hypothetical protein [Deltaproteobacteria bacterium]
MLSSFLIMFNASADPQVSLAYKVENKIGIWGENISGNILYNSQEVYYTKEGYAIKKNKGYKNINIYGGVSFTEKIPEGAISIHKANGEDSRSDYKIEEKKRETRSTFFIKLPNGKKKVIGRGHKNLVPYRWFTHDYPAPKGFTKPDKSFGWSKDGTHYEYKTPSKATKLTFKKATQEDISKWNKQVQVFAPDVTVKRGFWINTDLDDTLEQIVCGVGPRFKSCFIFDPEDNLWHNTQLNWEGADTPKPFSYNNETYIAYRSHPKSKILRILYFDGYSYKTEYFRPERNKRGK